jgi:hypothetical protein
MTYRARAEALLDANGFLKTDVTVLSWQFPITLFRVFGLAHRRHNALSVGSECLRVVFDNVWRANGGQVNLIDTTQVEWVDDEDEDEDEDVNVLEGQLGMETCIDLTVGKRPPATAATSRAYYVDVVRVTSDELIDGVRYPRDDTFEALAGEIKFLTINFPASGYWAAEQNPQNLQDPFTKSYCVTPQVRPRGG